MAPVKNLVIAFVCGCLLTAICAFTLKGCSSSASLSKKDLDTIFSNKLSSAIAEGKKSVYSDLAAKLDTAIQSRTQEIASAESLRHLFEKKLVALQIKPITDPDSAYLFLKNFGGQP